MGEPPAPTDDGTNVTLDDQQPASDGEPFSDDAAPDEGEFGHLPTLRFP